MTWFNVTNLFLPLVFQESLALVPLFPVVCGAAQTKSAHLKTVGVNALSVLPVPTLTSFLSDVNTCHQHCGSLFRPNFPLAAGA